MGQLWRACCFIEVASNRTTGGRRLELTQFIEVHNHKALVSVRLLDQHRVVREVVAPAFDTEKFPDATVRGGPEKLTLSPEELALRAGHVGSLSLRGHKEDRPTQVETSSGSFRLGCGSPNTV